MGWIQPCHPVLRAARGGGRGRGSLGPHWGWIPFLMPVACPHTPARGKALTTIISVGMGKRILCMYRALSSFTSTRKAPLMRAKMSEAMLVWGRFLQMSMKVWGRERHAHGLPPPLPIGSPSLGVQPMKGCHQC